MPTEPMGCVVVGVDGSASSLAAVDLAAEEAAGRVTPLSIVHVEDGRARPPQHGQAPDHVLAVAAAQALAEHPGLAVSTELLTGDPAETLVRRARDASLLVLGHRGLHDGGVAGLAAQFGIGSVAIQVIGQASVPVLIHRPVDASGDVAQPRPVLVGVAGILGDEAAIEFGFAEAELRGTPLAAMYVWSPAHAGSPPPFQPEHETLAGDHDEAERILSECLAGWAEKYPDVLVRRAVRLSLDVPVALVAASRSAQLVVVGSPRRSGFARLVHSSVSHNLALRAHCPVAIVAGMAT